MDSSRRDRKTTILRISRLPSSTSILEVAKELEFAKEDISLIKRFTPRNASFVNFFVEFASSEACEETKKGFDKKGGVKIDGEMHPVFFASSDSLQGMKSVISEDKLYVQYPPGTDHDELIKMFAGLKIVEPKEKKNFLFVICNDQKEQSDLKEKFDQKAVGDKTIRVNYAINKVRPTRSRGAVSE